MPAVFSVGDRVSLLQHGCRYRLYGTVVRSWHGGQSVAVQFDKLSRDVVFHRVGPVKDSWKWNWRPEGFSSMNAHLLLSLNMK